MTNDETGELRHSSFVIRHSPHAYPSTFAVFSTISANPRGSKLAPPTSDTAGIGSQLDPGVAGCGVSGGAHEAGANERDRCIVDTRAIVDSAPWLMFTPSIRRPS